MRLRESLVIEVVINLSVDEAQYKTMKPASSDIYGVRKRNAINGPFERLTYTTSLSRYMAISRDTQAENKKGAEITERCLLYSAKDRHKLALPRWGTYVDVELV